MALTQQFSSGQDLTAAALNASSIPVVSSTADITSPFTGQIIFNTTTTTLMRYTGSAWVVFDPAASWLRKTANESVTSSTTLQNDDTFAWAVAANTAYALDGYLVYDGDPAADLKMDFTGPAGSTMTWTNFGPNIGALAEYNVVTETLAAGSPRGVGTNSGTQMSARPNGTFTTAGTAGTLQFRWAQVVSSGTATRIMAHSRMCLTQIP